MALIPVTAAAGEPVSLAEQKAHMHVTSSAEDSLISGKIKAAREIVEELSNRQLITATWKLTLPRFVRHLDSRHGHGHHGEQWIRGPQGQRGYPLTGNNSHWGTTPEGQTVLYLPRAPLQGVASITYMDTTGTRVTLDSSVYDVCLGSVRTPGLIAIAYGQLWPDIQSEREGCIEVTYVAGYGTADAVPQAAKEAIMMLAAEMCERREMAITGMTIEEVPVNVQWLLENSLTVPEVA